MQHSINRSNLRQRYIFSGKLILDTALHIGGGRDYSSFTDSPILKDSLGLPLIPGSSFKGAFRAGIERLAPNLRNFSTCQLEKGFAGCLSTNEALSKAYGRVREAASQGAQIGVGGSQTNRNDRAKLKLLGHENWAGETLTEDQLLTLLDEHLCDTCKAFGSVHLASVVHFHDLPVDEAWTATTQIRDGVGIDRDSERAVDQIKFDYEVVPAQTQFQFNMTVENPTERDLGLLLLGLQEFVNGMIPLGGIRSRGLGRCHLEDVMVAILDFQDVSILQAYLTQENWAESAAQPLVDIVEQKIAILFETGDTDA